MIFHETLLKEDIFLFEILCLTKISAQKFVGGTGGWSAISLRCNLKPAAPQVKGREDEEKRQTTLDW